MFRRVWAITMGLVLMMMGVDSGAQQAKPLERDATLKAMQKMMGAMPGEDKRCALDVRVLEEADCGSYLRRLIAYQSEPGSTTPAYLLVPKAALKDGAAPVRGMLSLHSTSREDGHKVAVGLGPLPGRDNAHELALRGNVVIAPCYPLMGGYMPDLKELGYASGSMKAIWDNRRALDVLDSLTYVQHGRYGAIGHSLGGHNALFTAAFDERISAVVTSCGFDSFRDYKGGDLAGWAQDVYMPRIAGLGKGEAMPFDFCDVLAAVGPRPVFVNAPLHDDNFQWQSVDRMVGVARMGGAKVTVEHPDAGHDFPEDVRRKAYEFLEGN